MLKCTAAAALAAGLAVSAAPATAQPCGDRDDLVAKLKSIYEEHLVAAGMRDAEHLVELFATKDGRTWTLLLSRADGYACVLGAGNAWSGYPQEPITGIES